MLDDTTAVVIGQCGRAVPRSSRRTNAFTSITATLEDGSGDQIGEALDKAVYRELTELYTSPADWAVNLKLETGKYTQNLAEEYNLMMTCTIIVLAVQLHFRNF